MSDDHVDENAGGLKSISGAAGLALTPQDLQAMSKDELTARLAELRQAHRHLDSEVSALQSNGVTDMLKIARMKKMKLRMKDQIAALEDHLTPDIIA